MSESLQVFNFNTQPVRIIMQDGEPWFVAKDVCDVLELGNCSQALSRLDPDEVISNDVTDTIGRQQLMQTVSESGLYSLVMSSRKPEARQFKRWVTHEVLPSIRKHGGYLTEHTVESILSDPDTLIRLATTLKEEREQRKAAEFQATLLSQKVQENEREIKKLAPKAQYTDEVLLATNLVTTDSIAVCLGIRSAQRLSKWLEAEGYIYRRGAMWYPQADLRDKGYCDIQTTLIESKSKPGTFHTSLLLKWTELGKHWVIEKYKAGHPDRYKK